MIMKKLFPIHRQSHYRRNTCAGILDRVSPQHVQNIAGGVQQQYCRNQNHDLAEQRKHGGLMWNDSKTDTIQCYRFAI